MNAIYQSPWPLVITAAVMLVIIEAARQFIPGKVPRATLVIPLVVFAAAFGVDHFVKTDSEQVEFIFDKLKHAIVEQSPGMIEQYIHPEYTDIIHDNKDELMLTARTVLEDPVAEKIKARYETLEMQTGQNLGTITAEHVVHLAPSLVQGQGPQIVFAKTKTTFVKNPALKWVIISAELLELNKQPVDWSDIISRHRVAPRIK